MKDVDPDTGEVSFGGFSLRRVATVLHSSVKFSEEMPEGHEIGIVYQAVRSVAHGGKITPGRLLQTIRDRENAFTQLPNESFVLVTSISAKPFEDLTDREVGGATVIFDRYLPEPFRSEHEKAREIAENQVLGRLPKLGAGPMWAYVPTRIPVHARSHQEASEAALNALNLL